MQLNKTATNKTATTAAAKPATTSGKKKTGGTANNKPKAKKSPLDRAFITATALKRSVERLARLTSGWAVDGTGPQQLPIGAQIAKLKTGLDSAGSAADVVLAALMALVNAGFAPTKTRAPKVELAIGTHVVIKEKALPRFDYLTEAQLANLYISKEDDDRGFLLVSRTPGTIGNAHAIDARGNHIIETVVGYFKKSILKAAGEVETSEEDESDDSAE